VVDETLRLRGPAAMVARTALADDNILGHEVCAGDQVMPFFWGVHRHPDFWEDPDAFLPERFAPGAREGQDPFSYVPFSAGKRICIGNTFSLVESVLLIALLLQRATFSLVPDQQIGVKMIATLRPSAPVQVRLAWRG
jgi:cytochrome P450